MFKFFVGLSILASVVYASPTVKKICDEETGTKHPRIICGENAKQHIPYMVSIIINKSGLCGGAILNKNWILTAAHCVKGRTKNDLEIYAGNNNLTKQTDVYGNAKIILHDNYKTYHKDDIALIKVASPIKIDGNKLKSIEMDSEIVEPNETVSVCGWGQLNKNRLRPRLPKYLQCIEQTTINKTKCQPFYDIKHTIYDTHICALREDKAITYKGDSGSPLIRNGKVVGIVTFGVFGSPDVYTRVSSFYAWVKDTMATK